MDLKIGSIPLKIQGRFFLMALLLGLNERDPARLAVWVAVVLVSVVVHEMGHALMGMAFGFKPAIVLHGMGGHTTFGEGRWSSSTWRSILISLAGPFAGFALALGVIAATKLTDFHPQHPLAVQALGLIWWVNLAWGVFNLVPMLPLDGGNVFRSITTAVSAKKGEVVARVVSILVAASIGLWAVTNGQWWMLYLGALYGFMNVQAMRQAGQTSIDQPLAKAVEQSYGAINRNDTKGAIALLQPVLFASKADPDLRRAGIEVYVVALVKEGRTDDAVRTLERERDLIGGDDLRRYAGMLRKAGKMDEAARVDALVQKAAAFDAFRA